MIVPSLLILFLSYIISITSKYYSISIYDYNVLPVTEYHDYN